MATRALPIVIASINRALWGEVSARLRCVQFKPEKSRITIRFYFEGPPAEDDLESVGFVGAEVAADFPDWTVAEEAVATDPDSPVPHDAGWRIAFARKEPTLVR